MNGPETYDRNKQKYVNITMPNIDWCHQKGFIQSLKETDADPHANIRLNSRNLAEELF